MFSGFATAALLLEKKKANEMNKADEMKKDDEMKKANEVKKEDPMFKCPVCSNQFSCRYN